MLRRAATSGWTPVGGRWWPCVIAIVAVAMVGLFASPALAYKPQPRVADPSAWTELSPTDQHALLEYLSRGTPVEGTHYATTPAEMAEVQALEDAVAAVTEAQPTADLIAGSGAAAQGAKFLPTLAELAPWQIAAGAAASFGIGFLIGDTANRYWLHIGGVGLENPQPAGWAAVSGYHVWWHPGGPIFSPPAPQDLPAGLYLYHEGNSSNSEAFSDDDPHPYNAPPSPAEGDRHEWLETHGGFDIEGNFLSAPREYFVRLEPGDPGTTIDQPPRPATSQDTGRTVPWVAPADPATELSTAYGSGPLNGFRKWVCYALGHGCANPFRTYIVPHCPPTDTYADCAQRLDDAGLTTHHARTVIDPHAHLEQGPGTVLKTEPAAGSDVRNDTDVEVARNPDPLPSPADLASDPDCELSTPDYTGPVPASAGDAFDVVADPTRVQSQTFASSRGPTVLREGWVTTNFFDPDLNRYRYRGFGYRHIRAGHGWSVGGDDPATREALIYGLRSPNNNDQAADGSIFVGPQYTRGGQKCQRVVIVDFGTRVGEPAPEGIVTSYARGIG
jgi:hypothetical protein